MLWESSEPREALRERFGLDSFGDAVSWLTKVLAEGWALEVEACERILISDQNAIAWVSTDQGALVVKWSRAQERFGKFTAIAELLRALHEQGVPVAAPVPAVDGQSRVIVHSGALPLSMTVQPQVIGDLLEISDESAVRRAGACLADLHRALAKYDDSSLRGPDQDFDLRERIESWLEHQDGGLAPAASARLREQVASLPPIDAERQLIHNDYRASNILMDGSEVVAVIDFDEVAWDYCVRDLANSFVVLGTHFTKWQPTPTSARELFLEGYELVRQLSDLERRWLTTLTLWRAITAIPGGDDPAGWADAL
ncbi:phosphotransferase [Kribbella sp. NPDC051718]|uniref:phosphotransferase enzyme family protein n=1 Tax=Kribbella sp. NPDC051718 TaxID=3155168 RepID=UPI00342B4D35